ncbi:large ribosomal subunit protein mL49 [Penaeus vannamei]|uniref:large ribosomal subunit protein mL49 n=1 Tax=Penaeus vannamei TaxID=6689 RepID=UPI00387FB12A
MFNRNTSKAFIFKIFVDVIVGEVTPSGWVAPSAVPGDYPYFVPRSASHMLPVYVKHEPIMSRFTTSVKKVEGDAFALGEELRQYLSEKFAPKHINLRVHEPHRMIQIKGEYLLEVKEFLIRSAVDVLFFQCD